MLIGDKNKIGIEFEFENSKTKFGFGKIWIDNVFLGSRLDLIPFNYIISFFDEIFNSVELDEKFLDENKEKLFKKLYEDKTSLRDKYFVRGSTFLDDFSIYAYKLNGKINILWKIINRDFFDDLKDYPDEIFHKMIETTELNDFIIQINKKYGK